MHRMFPLPRLIGSWSLAFALLLQLGTNAVKAQPPLPAQSCPVIELAVGTSRTCQMTTYTDLKRVENPNSNVVRVERIPDKNNEILLVAEHPGRTTITFTDQKDRVEVREIIVAAGAVTPTLPVMALQPEPPGARTNEITIRMFPDDKGLLQGRTSVTITSAPLGGIENSDSRVVAIKQDDPQKPNVFRFEAQAIGFSKVVFFYDKERTRAEVYLINVVGPAPKSLELGVGQVELHVVVAVVNRSMGRNMSFSWNFNGPNWFLSSVIGGPGGLTSALAPGIGGSASTLTATGNANLPFGVLNTTNSFMGFLRATRDEGLTKILAEPRVVAFSGRPGNVISGGHVDIVAAGGISSAQISADFGTIVNFLPIIGPGVTKEGIIVPAGKIYLEVRPEVSTPTNTIPIPGAGGAGTVSFSVLKRSAQVSVMLEDTQTLAIGGLIQNRMDGSTSKVPVLGDMPFFGAAFRSVAYTEIEEEMIILVTPRLIHPVDCTKIPRYLPGRETRAPSDFELFLEGILEAPRGQRNVVFHPHLYKPAFHSAPNAGQIPCGDGGCSSRGGCSTGSCAPSHATLPTSGSSVAMPTFPETPSMPTSGSRIIMEPEAFPPIRDTLPNVTPTMPPRTQDPRPVLPPLSVPR